MKGNPWGFAILFLIVVLYFGLFHNWELPTVFWSDTTETKAIIVDSKMVLARNGSNGGTQQRIKFAYQKEDSLIFKTKKISARYGHRPVGSKLKLTFENKDPGNFRIESYYKSNIYLPRKRYFWSNRRYKHAYIYLQNNILKWEEFGKQGKLISSNYYRVDEKNGFISIYALFDSVPIVSLQADEFGIKDLESQRYFKLLKN